MYLRLVKFTSMLLSSIALCLAMGVSVHASDADKKQAVSGAIQVDVKTNLGTFTIELNNEKAPISTKNFLSYVDEGFYNGTVFHRVIAGFMIQTGGFDQAMQKKSTKSSIKNEADNGLKNKRGTLAMARTSDVNSATSQFFINVKDNSFLDNGARDFGYAVFGKVVEGMEVVDKIAAVKTGRKNFMKDVPLESVVIVSAKRK